AIVEGAGLGEGAIAGDDIKAFVAEYLAGYKVPRLIFAIDSMQRAANGKPDYPFLTDYAERCLGKT
ncbi:MAG: AMP-binding protein, partial [Halioglobus sp.]|nr:AMP-binding protein [Halioglobus sp.]